MRYLLVQSKTSIYRYVHRVYISKLNSVLFPVKITQKQIQKANILKEGGEYMFPAQLRNNMVIVFQTSAKPLPIVVSWEDILNVFNKSGLSNNSYGLHSKCACGGTMTTHFGVKKRLIKKHGCQKSDRVKDRYTHSTQNNLLLVSQNLVLQMRIYVCLPNHFPFCRRLQFLSFFI